MQTKQQQRQDAKMQNLFKLNISDRDSSHFLLHYTNGRTHELAGLNEYEKEELIDRLAKSVKLAIPKQIQKLQCLYRELKIVDHKKEVLLQFTNGRTDSTAGLSFEEARQLIQELAQHEPSERLRKAVFSFAYKAGIIYGDTETDKLINRAKLNMFLRDRGTVKKDIEKQTFPELKKTLGQMAAMVTNVDAATDNKYAKQATNQLLSQLNITVKK
jgi:DNA polymerase/3'-5' exonuclease PolX